MSRSEYANTLLIACVLVLNSVLLPAYAQCVDIQDKKYSASLAIVEIKRRIPHLFEELTSEKVLAPDTLPVVVTFSVGGDKQPVNINIEQPSGKKLIDEAAMEAVKLAAPYRLSDQCYRDLHPIAGTV